MGFISIKNKVFLWLRLFFFGEKCVCCGEMKVDGSGVICDSCRSEYIEEMKEPCPLCGRPVSSCLCMPPELSESGAECLIKSAFYKPSGSKSPINKLVYRLKEKRDRPLASELAKYLSMTLEREYPDIKDNPSGYTVTWIPRSKAKIRATGTDQAKLLAEALSEAEGLSRWQTIVRSGKNTGFQKSLNARGRSSNVNGLYRIVNPGCVFGRKVILVDDLCTSGSTMGECCSVLLGAGALKVICVAPARTSKR